jgi:DNA-binding transcriptional LysR family regulator
VAVDWDRIRIFRTIAKAGSFTRGAESLGVSQSAASRQVTTLEHELGVPLFVRHARGLLLTEQGELLFKTAEDMRTRLENTQKRMAETSEVPSGTLKVNATIGFGGTWLARRIAEFLDLYPSVHVELILTSSELDVSMREADLAIRLRRPEQPDLIQRRLFTVHHHAYASRGYIDRFGEPKAVEDLDNHRIVALGGQQPPFILAVHTLGTLGRPPNVPRTNVILVNDSHALRRAVEAGAGIGVAPGYVVELNSGLVPVLHDAEIPTLDAYLVYPTEMRSVARLQVFRDFLVSKAPRWAY